jgi:hypothetical protein
VSDWGWTVLTRDVVRRLRRAADPTEVGRIFAEVTRRSIGWGSCAFTVAERGVRTEVHAVLASEEWALLASKPSGTGSSTMHTVYLGWRSQRHSRLGARLGRHHHCPGLAAARGLAPLSASRGRES